MAKTLRLQNISFLFLIIFVLSGTSCEREDEETLFGKWKYFKVNSTIGGLHYLEEDQQEIVEFTQDSIRIIFDYQGVEITRCKYYASDSTITIYGENLNGQKWSSEELYWFENKELVIRFSGGFEYSDNYFTRLKR